MTEISNTTKHHESKYSEYKWKAPKQNSLDFFIEFKKNPQSELIELMQEILKCEGKTKVRDLSEKYYAEHIETISKCKH